MNNITQDTLETLYEYLGGYTTLHQSPESFKAQEYHNSSYYKVFSIPKTNGTRRIIQEPKPELKRIQRQLIHLFRSYIQFPEWVYGVGNNTGSAVDCARIHHRARILVKMDIEKFFPSTTQYAVLSGLHKLVANQETQDLLSSAVKLCVIKVNDSPCEVLPTGAPTSPLLSTIAFLPIDKLINQYCMQHNIKYTRYIDDLIFSMNEYVPGFQKDITKLVQENSCYRINHKKNQVRYRGSAPQVVTGVTLNGCDLSISKSFKKQLRTELDHWARGNHTMLSGKLAGCLAYVKNVNPNQYQYFMQYYKRRQKKYHAATIQE